VRSVPEEESRLAPSDVMSRSWRAFATAVSSVSTASPAAFSLAASQRERPRIGCTSDTTSSANDANCVSAT